MSQRMKLVEFTVLKRDVDRVLLVLGGKAYMEFDLDGREGAPAEAEGAAPRTVEALARAAEWLGIRTDGGTDEAVSLATDEDRVAATEIIADAERVRAEQAAIAKRREAVEQAAAEIKAFMRLEVAPSELELLTFIHVAVGRVAPERLASLPDELGNRAIVLDLDGTGRIAALSSKKGRFALETALKAAGFAPRNLPGEEGADPSEIARRLDGELAGIAAREAEIERERMRLSEEAAGKIPRLLRRFEATARTERVKERLVSTEHAYFFRGWVERQRLPAMAAELEAATDGRIAARSFDPEEVPSVASGKEKVPVAMKHGRFLSSFKNMVFSYGIPRYGTVDPTPFVACWFVLFFSIMFGDLGQGLVILLVGVALAVMKRGKLLKWKKFAPILMAVGAGAMIMGFLEGSFFAFEEVLVPATRFITGKLFGTEMDRIVNVMPSGGLGKMIAFFGFSVALGVVVNSVGIVLNMVNLARMGRKGELFFSKTGLAGALLFWYALSLAVRALLGSRIGGWDVLPLALPTAALFFAHPLERLVDGHRPLMPDGGLSFAIGGFVEVLETGSYYLSNTVSFLRVGAFSLSHAVLSFVVFTTSEMMHKGLPVVGGIGRWGIVVIGNVIIMALEGMVVTIQVMRLQYYEFFSKFFTETGRAWKPFSFRDAEPTQGKGD